MLLYQKARRVYFILFYCYIQFGLFVLFQTEVDDIPGALTPFQVRFLKF